MKTVPEPEGARMAKEEYEIGRLYEATLWGLSGHNGDLYKVRKFVGMLTHKTGSILKFVAGDKIEEIYTDNLDEVNGSRVCDGWRIQRMR